MEGCYSLRLTGLEGMCTYQQQRWNFPVARDLLDSLTCCKWFYHAFKGKFCCNKSIEIGAEHPVMASYTTADAVTFRPPELFMEIPSDSTYCITIVHSYPLSV